MRLPRRVRVADQVYDVVQVTAGDKRVKGQAENGSDAEGLCLYSFGKIYITRAVPARMLTTLDHELMHAAINAVGCGDLLTDEERFVAAVTPTFVAARRNAGLK